MKLMLKNNQNKVANCKWCNKKILHTEAYATLPNKEYSCIKCFKNSGHMLPFWDIDNKSTFKK
tara:strand:- start:344 stop:532 length:189 start_codon:yes stop_codon:yes gene_type:complete